MWGATRTTAPARLLIASAALRVGRERDGLAILRSAGGRAEPATLRPRDLRALMVLLLRLG